MGRKYKTNRPGLIALGVAAAIVSVPGQAWAAEGDVIEAKGAPIEGSYIVVLKDGTSATSTATEDKAVKDKAAKVAKRRGGKIGRTFAAGLDGFTVKASETEARRLAADPEVAFVEQDAYVSVADTQKNPTWGLDRIDQRTKTRDGSYTYPTTASNVDVYILDTGIRATHADLAGRVKGGAGFVNDGKGTQDCNGHGTHVAGTVGGSTWGVAKKVDLIPVRVLGCTGGGSISGVISGVNWVAANASGPSVVNMSLGGTTSTSLDSAVKKAIAKGITFAVAAGNESVNACKSSPASVTEAITVGAVDQYDKQASFSNYGTCVDLYAPGVQITSAYYTSDTATKTMSGTSMATPHVAGVAALYLSANPTATPAQVATALATKATANILTGLSTGSPNRMLYSEPTATTVAPAKTTTTAPKPAPIAPTPKAAPTRTSWYAKAVKLKKTKATTSKVTVSGTGITAAKGEATVVVKIKRVAKADLAVQLVRPNGSTVTLHRAKGKEHGANLTAAYAVPAGTVLDGSWQLRVRTLKARSHNGLIASFGLRLNG